MRPTIHRFLALVLAALSLAACEQLNAPGDIGISSRSQATPVPVFGNRTWIDLSAGYQHTCGVDDSNMAWCWGANTFGQLGVATAAGNCPDVETCALRPLQVSGGHLFSKIAAGVTHTCAIRTDGRLMCWGGGLATGGNGFLGTDSTAMTKSLVPQLVLIDSTFSEVAIGFDHTCAITTNGQVWCWGSNDWGEAGDSSDVPRLKPVPVRSNNVFTQIALGWMHTCALKSDGRANCWGRNNYGQVGNNRDYGDSLPLIELLPQRLPEGNVYTKLVTGVEHSCGVRDTGGIDCWGRNNNASQLGDGSGILSRNSPGPLDDGRVYTTMASGSYTVCGRDQSGNVFCWGSNQLGTAGIGTRSAIPIPTPMPVTNGAFASVSGGGAHMCALDASQKAYCWGDQKYGQLGR